MARFEYDDTQSERRRSQEVDMLKRHDAYRKEVWNRSAGQGSGTDRQVAIANDIDHHLQHLREGNIVRERTAPELTADPDLIRQGVHDDYRDGLQMREADDDEYKINRTKSVHTIFLTELEIEEEDESTIASPFLERFPAGTEDELLRFDGALTPHPEHRSIGIRDYRKGRLKFRANIDEFSLPKMRPSKDPNAVIEGIKDDVHRDIFSEAFIRVSDDRGKPLADLDTRFAVHYFKRAPRRLFEREKNGEFYNMHRRVVFHHASKSENCLHGPPCAWLQRDGDIQDDDKGLGSEMHLTCCALLGGNHIQIQTSLDGKSIQVMRWRDGANIACSINQNGVRLLRVISGQDALLAVCALLAIQKLAPEDTENIVADEAHEFEKAEEPRNLQFLRKPTKEIKMSDHADAGTAKTAKSDEGCEIQ